jgi:hypothetical protein
MKKKTNQTLTVIRSYTASDGTQLVQYQDDTGYVNTVPKYIYNKMIKKSR